VELENIPEDESVVGLLIGTAVARRLKQLKPDVSEDDWFLTALAAKNVWDVIDRATPDADPLAALDEWFMLESML